MKNAFVGALSGCAVWIAIISHGAAQIPCPNPIPDSPRGEQYVACLKELQAELQAVRTERAATRDLVVITCEGEGQPTPATGQWTFSFGDSTCKPSFGDLEIVGGYLFQSYICGGHNNHVIGLSPPSITFYGVPANCNTHRSYVRVQFLARQRRWGGKQ